MLDLTELIFTVDNILTYDECRIIMNEFKESDSVKEHCYEVNDNEIRESTVDIQSLIPETEPFRIIAEKTNELIEKYFHYIDSLEMIWTEYMMTNLAYSHNYRLMRYSEGQSIHDHVDKSPFVFGSATFTLNDNYEGGDFRFFKGKYKLRTKAGQGMIFPAESYFVHGVDKILNGMRYSVNSFLGSEECVVPRNKFNYGSDYYFHPYTQRFRDYMENESKIFYMKNVN